jgi:hypothetical protein
MVFYFMFVAVGYALVKERRASSRAEKGNAETASPERPPRAFGSAGTPIWNEGAAAGADPAVGVKP